MHNQPQRSSQLVILTVCLTFVFVWGAIGLTSDSITPAEYNSIFNIFEDRLDNLSTLAGTLNNVATKDETHPPGYFLLLNVWSRFVGADLLPLRLLSIYFGLFTVAFTYRLSWQIGTAGQATASAIALAIMAYFGFYLHEARMYSLLAMVSALTAWSYFRLVYSSTKHRGHWLISLCLSSAAAIYTHAFGFVLLAAIGLYHLVFIPKNRHWLLVSLAMFVAGCLYLPWLPNAMLMLGIRTSYASDSLAWHEAVLALASIYNNGLGILALACGALLVLNRNRISPGQRALAILVALVLLLSLAVNEVAPIIVARRIRYSIVLAPLWACTLAIAASLLPRWNRLRLPVLVIWILAFIAFNQSPALYLYTNSQNQNRRQIPHYQTLLHTPGLPIRTSDYILSFQHDTELGSKTLDYYGRKTGDWRGLIHIWNDADGSPAVQSTDRRYLDLPSMEIWNFPIWLIHNPQETDLLGIDAFASAFSDRFHTCGRYLETDTSTIELYVKRHIPCKLLTSPQPLEIRYENGTELANIVLQPHDEKLNVYLWWTKTVAGEYAFSLQLFDSDSNMAAQFDDVIGGDALTASSIETADLPAGEYSAKLIVYDFQSQVSLPGMTVDGQRRFDREVDIARLRLSD